MRSKYNLNEFIRMLSNILAAVSMAKRRRESGLDVLDGAGGWSPAFPLAAEPRTTAMDLSPLQPEIVNARDAIVTEPLNSPDAAVSPSSQPKVMNVVGATNRRPMSAKSEVAIAGVPLLPSHCHQKS